MEEKELIKAEKRKQTGIARNATNMKRYSVKKEYFNVETKSDDIYKQNV